LSKDRRARKESLGVCGKTENEKKQGGGKSGAGDLHSNPFGVFFFSSFEKGIALLKKKHKNKKKKCRRQKRSGGIGRRGTSVALCSVPDEKKKTMAEKKKGRGPKKT